MFTSYMQRLHEWRLHHTSQAVLHWRSPSPQPQSGEKQQELHVCPQEGKGAGMEPVPELQPLIMAYRKGPIKGGTSTACLTVAPHNRSQNCFWRPHQQEPCTDCGMLIRGLEEPPAKCASHHSTKSRLGGKVGMTTIYKLKSSHTSGGKGITFRARENTCPPHVCIALPKPAFLLPKLSISWAAC